MSINQSYYPLIAGYAAGWARVTIAQPLDFIKTHLQISTSIPNFLSFYSKHGIRGFYRGASGVYLFIGSVSAVEFAVFETAWQALTRHSSKQVSLSGWQMMFAGGFSGLVASFIYTPLEFTKIRAQVSEKQKPQGSLSRMYQILKREKSGSLRILYQGLGLTILREIPGCILYYTGFYYFLEHIFLQKRSSADITYQVLSGSIAGLLYQLYGYPFDTIKTNIQSGRRTLKETLNSSIWKSPSFRMGFIFSLLRNMISDAANLTVYEQCLRRLQNRRTE